MTLPTSEDILSAVHSCLSDDMHVKGALGDPVRIYDFVPETPVQPYVEYGSSRLEDISGDDAPMASLTLNLHVHSRYAGKSEAMGILTLLLKALERDRLRTFLPGTCSVVSKYADSFTARDGHSRHSVLRVAITVAQPVQEAA